LGRAIARGDEEAIADAVAVHGAAAAAHAARFVLSVHPKTQVQSASSWRLCRTFLSTAAVLLLLLLSSSAASCDALAGVYNNSACVGKTLNHAGIL